MTMAREAYVKDKDQKPEIFTVKGKKYHKGEKSGKMFLIKPKPEAGKAEKSNAPNAEKLLASVMNAAGNKNAVALAAFSAKDLEAAKVIITNAELAAKVFGMKAVAKDVKAAEILKANKKLAAILTGKAKK